MSTLTIVIQKGVTFQLSATSQDSDGVPTDLTGYTASFKVKEDPRDSEFLYELTQGAGITLGGALGTVLVQIDGADTDIDAERGVYTLDLFPSTTDPSLRLLEGRVRFDPKV